MKEPTFLDWAKHMAEKLPAAPMRMSVVDAEAAQVWTRLHNAEELLEWITAEIHSALQADLENGVAWMNDEASAKFAKDYPCLCATLNETLKRISNLNTQEENP